jgi:peptidoglycan-associated lipoprotein
MSIHRIASMTARGIVAVALASSLAVVGCSKKSADADEAGLGDISSSEFDTGTSGQSEYGEGEPEKVRELASVYFDFDRSDIRSDARSTLQSNAQAIASHREWRSVILEGHTDERGSEEYNLALGERRAGAAMQYLSDLGVPASRMQTVSFGKSAPAVQGHDESAWRWNRRVEFRVTR